MLVVDDSLAVRAHLRSLLEARGVSVVLADSAETGIAAAAAAPYGCILMDVLMPGIEALFRVSGEAAVHSAAMEARVTAFAERSRELLAQNLRVQKRLFELETLVEVRALTMMRARTPRVDEAAFDPLEMDQ